MPAHLTPQWLAALDHAATRHEGLTEAARGCHLIIEQVVTDPGGDVTWHVTIDDGTVRFAPGPAGEPTIGPVVRFTTDKTTAEHLVAGRTTTQTAFMAGRLQVGGDTGALLAHHSLVAGLDDVFAGVDTTIATPDTTG